MINNIVNNRYHIAYASITLITLFIACIFIIIERNNVFFYFTYWTNFACLFTMIIDVTFLCQKKEISKTIGLCHFVFLIEIIIVGIVYNTLLSNIFSMDYWRDVLSLTLHFITPILYSLYVLGFRKTRLPNKYSNVLYTLIPPYLFITTILIRQYIIKDNWYPYFFLDVSKLGYINTAIWIVLLTIVFLGMSLLLIKYLKKIK